MNKVALHKKQKIRLHLTNIAGVGAVKLLESILPNFINQDSFELEEVYLPLNSNFLNNQQFSKVTKLNYYKRFLPNSISRFLECTIFGGIFNGESPLLILGDLPIRCKSKQIVFLQNTLLLPGDNYVKGYKVFKYWVLRWIFKKNLKYVDKFIVQTKFMKSLLIKNYPEFTNKVDVISQPVPEWLIKSGINCKEFTFSHKRGLRLFYPAAFYPHKNHIILNKINHLKSLPISEIILTIPNGSLDINSSPLIKCIGMQNEDSITEIYSKTDALLFLSLTESYGFPLIEAMWLGLPIICCDLEYTRSLCGTEAIYFKHNNVNSLHRAICELENRLKKGWRPKWDNQLLDVPKNWKTVAIRILNSACS